MQVYLVGGAVRDELLGRPVTERDWVVVGATPEELQAQGYRAVGRDFPVFLHPQTREEYALARLERKTGPGYRGFATQHSRDVSLEQDLQRRDLTINAMARATDGTLVDPYGGKRDIEQRRLRHVSPAFTEDPVRVLRVARFAARYAGLGFEVAPETMELMRQMVADGEIAALIPERLWREMQRALEEPHPEVFFDVLHSCGALAALLPELRWDHDARRRLVQTATLGSESVVRFAALLACTPAEAISLLCERLRVPSEYRELALLCARLKARLADPALMADAGLLTGPQLLEMLESADAFRRPDRFSRLLQALRASLGADGEDGGVTQRLAQAATATASVSLSPERLAQLRGPAIAAALHAARLQRLLPLLTPESQ
jgi:tRNA nucleotidyltransferase (CCA-adding enzyme)